jgi:hypothetical protein
MFRKPDTKVILSGSFQHNQEPVIEPATKVVTIKTEPLILEQ